MMTLDLRSSPQQEGRSQTKPSSAERHISNSSGCEWVGSSPNFHLMTQQKQNEWYILASSRLAKSGTLQPFCNQGDGIREVKAKPNKP